MTIKKSPNFTADDKAWQYIRELELKLKRKSDELKAYKQTYIYKAFQAAEDRIKELEKQLEGYEKLS